MIKAYKYRMYPTKAQQVLLAKHFGCVRFLYNLALETRISAWKSGVTLNKYDLIKQIPNLKTECGWLKEVSAQSLQSTIGNLDIAYQNFFKKKSNFPKFKNKHCKQSFSIPQYNRVNFEKGLLFCAKFKEGIRTIFHREFEGKVKTCTISKTSTGKYYVSVLVEQDVELQDKPEMQESTAIGIDLGIKSFAVTSEGEVIDNPRFLKNSLDRLKILQRRASNKKKGSNNRKKANLRVALCHEKIRNKRKDYLHKLSSKIVSENQTICLEDLQVSNMIKNRKLSQAISDVSWSMFNDMLEYKSKWYGTNLIRADKFDPSSKMCSCGVKNDSLKLSDRVWICQSCKRVNERDLLAAQNIKKFAFNKNKSGQELSVEPVEMSTLVESMKQETQPIGSAVGG